MKEEIKQALIEKVELELKSIAEAALASKTLAQDGDLKSDGKYDTRGIEAGYLAGAQAKRLEELKLERQMLEEIPLREFTESDEIGIGALVDVEFNSLTRKYFLATTAGGTMLNIQGQGILVISVFSPIGDAIVDQRVGDEFELETPQGKRSYTIVGVS